MKKIFAILFTIGFFNVLIVAQNFLIANDEGLFDVEKAPKQLVANTAIYSIEKKGNLFYFLCDKGLMCSEDLKNFRFLNKGLDTQMLKLERNGTFELVKKYKKLKDLAFHPRDKNIFVTATNNKVFLTMDAGKSWKNLGTYGNANGIKAVAVASLADSNGEKQITVFVSTSIYGIAWKQPFISNRWYDANRGLAMGAEGPEEVSDILICNDESETINIFLSQSFTGKLYKYNWDKKASYLIQNNDKKISEAKYLDSLNYASTLLSGVKENEIFVTTALFPKVFYSKYNDIISKQLTGMLKNIKVQSSGIFKSINAAFISKEISKLNKDLSFKELFALRLENERSIYEKKANQKKAIYVPMHKLSNMQEYFSIMEKNKLNAIVLDMKDDSGFIRYQAKDISITKHSAVKTNIDMGDFIRKAKEKNIYLIARLVVFKDKQLYYYVNGKYAVKDYTSGKNWLGYQSQENGSRNYYYEYWVDPFNEEVWKYNVAVANELVELGFDEIQFDYIRFPTDGDNLRNAYYPAQASGMDKEAAIVSFLSYARKHIRAAISIDIYGANGWYRTGGRTGQEVEIFSNYVDIICPMYYPSHFAQSFLAYEPKRERPYRIYYQGAYRAKFIARNKAIIRPWAQCFYIPVSYDRQFYGAYYIKSQIKALKDSINEGFAFWNSVGNYKDLPSLE